MSDSPTMTPARWVLHLPDGAGMRPARWLGGIPIVPAAKIEVAICKVPPRPDRPSHLPVAVGRDARGRRVRTVLLPPHRRAGLPSECQFALHWLEGAPVASWEAAATAGQKAAGGHRTEGGQS
ncbi:Uncharacterised protein [Mycobacteroides abscessus subsp. abscessus]|nr:Uncharacterised protein [Mycobacteroides abscessus subsp. abscessus]SIA00285.1 Uncharacterised protein [Mycobacteroides abscessus subsp. abscessus]